MQNSSAYCLALLEALLGITLLPAAFRARLTSPVHSIMALRFFLMGWARPDAQHDVVEFLDFLMPLVPIQAQYRWEAHRPIRGELVCTEEGHLGSCLSLSHLVPASQAKACILFSCRRSSRSLSLLGLEAWTFVGIVMFMWPVWYTMVTSLLQVTTRHC